MANLDDSELTPVSLPSHKQTGRTHILRGTNTSSPARPSPLRTSSLIETTHEDSLEESLDNTLITKKLTYPAVAIPADMTPPPTTNAMGLTIVDGSPRIRDGPRSHSADGRSEHTPEEKAFVQHMGLADPFKGPSGNKDNDGNNAAPPPSYSQAAAARIQSTLVTPAKEFSPRADRLNQDPTPQNAQGLYEPAAAIFVANLASHRSDDQLEFSVHDAFQIYADPKNSEGRCFVKIRRDKNHHPYAFIQYTTVEAAKLAIETANGLLIDDRAVRVEPARAPCVVAIARIDGVRVTEAEARQLLEPCGPIKASWPVSPEDLVKVPLAFGGMWVRFAYFSDCKDAIQLFKVEPYRLHSPPDPKPTHRPVHAGSPHTPGQYGEEEKDRKSIYIGRLPDMPKEVIDQALRVIFSPYGNILRVSPVRKQIKGTGTWNSFAFIEFDDEAQAFAACSACSAANVTVLGKDGVLVQRKQWSARHNNRSLPYHPYHQHYMTPLAHGSPFNTPYAHMGYGDPQNTTALMHMSPIPQPMFYQGQMGTPPNMGRY